MGEAFNKKRAMYIEDDKTSMKFFLLLALLYSVIFMTKNCFNSAMAAVVSEGIMTKSQAGFITSAFYMVYGPLQIVGGILADKKQPENMIKIGLIGSFVANLVIFFNHNYYVMLTAWVFNGIAQLAIYPALFKIITSKLSPEWRKKGIYYFSFTGTVGLILGYIVAAFVTKWEYNFLLSSIVSIALYFGFKVACRRVSKQMIPEESKISQNEHSNGKTEKISTFKLFVVSGFLLLLPMGLIKYMIENSIKTFTPTMLLESYTSIGVTLSNLLNIFVLLSSVLGMILVRKLFFPKLVRNEVSAVLWLLLMALPFAVLIKFVGVLNVFIIITATCLASAFLSGSSLISGFINGSFSKYGKNGTAVGVFNSASSIGAVLQSYGFAFVADNYGWGAVTNLYIIGILVCILFTACALPFWKKFKDK